MNTVLHKIVKEIYFLLLPAIIMAPMFLSAQASPKDLLSPIRARQLGPAVMSGRVTDIDLHPSNPNMLLVGSAGGGVWKSQNGGLNFTSVFDDYIQSIGCVVFDPHTPDTKYWVGTGETWTRNSTSYGDGIYQTTDGGKTWKQMGLEKSERISSIVVHPEDPNVIFVGVLGALWSDSEDRGIYKSSDGGETWEKIYYTSPKTGCSDLIMDPENPDILYASMWEFRRTAWSFESGGDNSALLKSTDGGKTWKKIHQGFPTGKLGRIAVAISPSNPSILYSVVEGEDKSKDGLYRSDDAGASWTHLNNDFGLVLRPFYFARIVVDPINPDIVAKAGLYGSISRDGGKTFKSLGAMHADIHDIVFDYNNTRKMFFGNDGGVNISFDGGASTVFVDNLPLSQYYHVSVDQQEPYNVYGGLQDNGCWIGPSDSPDGITGSDWLCVGQGDGFRVYPHPENPKIVYSEMQGAENVWRYDISTMEIKVITPSEEEGDPEYRYNWNASLTTSPNVADRLYLGSQFVLRSEDRGDSWQKISPDLTTNNPEKYDNDDTGGLTRDKSGAENHCTIFTIAESPIDKQMIWVGSDDGLVHVTRNGGKKWENVTANIAGLPSHTWCYHIEASSHDKGVAYAVFDGHTRGDMKPYLFMTRDYGETWTSLITDDVKGASRSFQEDIHNPDMLYLGTEVGLFVSLDKGQSWTKFENEFPAVAVHYLTMSHTGDLVAGTHGRGVIIVDGLDKLRAVDPTKLEEDFFFIDLGPQEFYEKTVFGGYAGNTTEFYGTNPSRSIKIAYYMKKKPLFGKSTLKIYNEKGEEMAEIVPSKSKGLNEVEWSGTRKRAKMAEGHVPSQYGFAQARVPAGKYKVVFENKKLGTHEQFITLQYPKNSKIPPADREIRNKASEELHDLTQDLAYLVYNIDGQIDWLATNESIDGSTTSLADQLMDLKKTLVVTSGDLYTNAQDPELRENIAVLAYRINSNYSRPTQDQLKELLIYTKEYTDAQDSYAKIMESKEWKKLSSKAESSEVAMWQPLDFEDFIKED